MLKYPCLVLDHDDTVVQSESTINYPFFVYILDQYRPGATITLDEYVEGCCHLGFADMCRKRWQFTEAEMLEEYTGWKEYSRKNTPPLCPGIDRIIRKHKELGGILCVSSLSTAEIIERDYSQNADATQEYLMREKWGVAVVFSGKGFGKYTIAA